MNMVQNSRDNEKVVGEYTFDAVVTEILKAVYAISLAVVLE